MIMMANDNRDGGHNKDDDDGGGNNDYYDDVDNDSNINIKCFYFLFLFCFFKPRFTSTVIQLWLTTVVYTPSATRPRSASDSSVTNNTTSIVTSARPSRLS